MKFRKRGKKKSFKPKFKKSKGKGKSIRTYKMSRAGGRL